MQRPPSRRGLSPIPPTGAAAEEAVRKMNGRKALDDFHRRIKKINTTGNLAASDRASNASSADALSSASIPNTSRGSSGNPDMPPIQRFSSTSSVAPTVHSSPSTVIRSNAVPCSEEFPVSDAQIGPRHFTRLKLLGRGGIGQVFLVRLRDTDKLYAMKVLTKEEMIAKNKIKRVMTEREILATANHPFIVTMYASFQTSDRLCFVMEYCAGGEFFRVLQRQPKKRLAEEAVKFYAAEVLLALEYLHHLGFIYRDLKPENILMRENGHIAVTDFDLSKQAHAVSPRVIQQHLSFSDKLKKTFSMKRNNSSLNNLEIVNSEPVLPYQTNSFVGTEEYFAPEVVNGVAQSSSVDWWTLGILIYEMLTGTTPFKGSAIDETFNNIVKETVKWPDDITVSKECKSLVRDLLKREPEKRLGAQNGASDIKNHKWFSKFNFELIRNERPPIIPKLRDPKDLSQYSKMDDDDKIGRLTESDPYLPDKGKDNPFQNFDMRRNESMQRRY